MNWPQQASLPVWIKDPPPLEDEIINGPWSYHVLQMANRSYRPRRLAYYRTPYGEDHRLKYMVYFLDVRDQRVLELGPLEGHSSLILEKMGVRELVSVEVRDANIAKGALNNKLPKLILTGSCTFGDVCGYAGCTSN